MRFGLILLPLIVAGLPYYIERQQVLGLPRHTLTIDDGIGYLERREALKQMEDLKDDFLALEFRNKVREVLKKYKKEFVSLYAVDNYGDCDDDMLPSRIIIHNGEECTSDPKQYIDRIRSRDPNKLDASRYTVIEAKDLDLNKQVKEQIQDRFGVVADVDYVLYDGDKINQWQL